MILSSFKMISEPFFCEMIDTLINSVHLQVNVRVFAHPLADEEAYGGSGPMSELHQRHQVLVVHHVICRC